MPSSNEENKTNSAPIASASPGDIIYRVDAPHLRYKIIGTDADWQTAWDVERVNNMPGTHKAGMVFKDDDRWAIEKPGARTSVVEDVTHNH